jgi:DNA-binding transcriptional MocR family regulator
MPDANKQRLVELCAERGVVLIEDDIYAELGDGPVPPRAAKAWDAAGGVIHCGSLHKTLAPGMRLGWMLGGRWLERIVMLKHAHSRSNDALTQRAVARFLASAGYDRHLARLRERLRRWREDAADTIAASFPEGTRLHVPSGGMLLWVELPQRRSAYAVFERALAEGIRVAPGRCSRTPAATTTSCASPAGDHAAPTWFWR